jgi:hypothetical protein
MTKHCRSCTHYKNPKVIRDTYANSDNTKGWVTCKHGTVYAMSVNGCWRENEDN